MSTQFIKVLGVSAPRVDKNQVEYKTLTLGYSQSLKTVNPSTGEEIEVKLPSKTTTVNTYADPAAGPNTNLFDAKAGDLYAGAIVTREVDPYTIQGRGAQGMITLSQYSTAVFGDTTSPEFDQNVISTFARNKRPIKGIAPAPDTAGLPAERVEAVKPAEVAVKAEEAEAAW